MRMKVGIKHKIAIIFIGVGIILAAATAAVVYAMNYKQVSAQYTDMAFNSAHMAAAIVDADSIENYLLNGTNDSYYDSERLLGELKRLNNLEYLYVVRPADDWDNWVYIFDVYTDGNDPEFIYKLGDHVGVSDLEYAVVREIYLTGESAYSATITTTEYGHLATACVPVFGSDGKITGVACADIRMDTVLRDIRMQTLTIAGIVLEITILSLLIILFMVNKKAIKPVIDLSRHMANFNSDDGQLTHFAVSNSGDEIQTMAESFNVMVSDIKLYIENLAITTAEKERIGAELDVATHIQASLLPRIFPAFPERDEFDIHASMIPAKEVGGDFYDFFLVDDNTLAVVMADVSGKGVPAALFMVIAKTLIKNNAQTGKSPREVFETVNDMLCENNDAGMFVTAFMGYIDLESGSLTYVNAGHNPPLIKRAGEEFIFLKEKPSLILACFEGVPYVERKTNLSVGDLLYLYTDGVTEAMNIGEDLFSDLRMIETANRNRDCPPRELIEAIGKEVDIFAKGAEQADDITMLALQYKGKK